MHLILLALPLALALSHSVPSHEIPHPVVPSSKLEPKPIKPVEPNPEPKPKPKPSIEDFLYRIVWVGQMKQYKDKDVMKGNPCPAGYPMYSTCDVNDDCPDKMECMENKVMGSRFCCLKEEATKYMSCPDHRALTGNKYCSKDSECSGDSTCVKEFNIYEEFEFDFTKEYKEPKILRTEQMEVGVCCMNAPDMDKYPKTMQSCPAKTHATRRLPCGVGLEGCELGSTCYYAEDAYGRCCALGDSTAKLTSSNLYGHHSRYYYSKYHSPHYHHGPYHYPHHGHHHGHHYRYTSYRRYSYHG